MINKVYIYAIAALLAVLAIVGSCWYVSHLKTAVTLAQGKQAVAEASVSTCAAALVQADQATADAQAQAKIIHDQAQAIVDSATTQKGKNTAAGTVFTTTLTTSAKATGCQSVLEASLCPALSGY